MKDTDKLFRTASEYMNLTQPRNEFSLSSKDWAHCTYAQSLRLGNESNEEIFWGRNAAMLDDMVFTHQEQGRRLALVITHGRLDENEEMDDWGFDAPDSPEAHLIHQRPSGLYLFTFRQPDKPKLEFIPIKGDMLFYKEAYYGDWSFVAASALKEQA